MNLADDVRAYADLITSSFDNAMSTVESIHQGVVEMTLGVLTEAGLPRELADGFAQRHRRSLRVVYGAICSANHDLGDMVVVQMEQIGAFADSIGVPFPDSPSETVDGAVSGLTRRAAK